MQENQISALADMKNVQNHFSDRREKFNLQRTQI